MDIFTSLLLALLPFCVCAGSGQMLRDSRHRVINNEANFYGKYVVCYFTPTSYFPTTKVPSSLCTHILYAFGSISVNQGGPNITRPTKNQESAWATLTSLRTQNPDLKVMLSLQQGFPEVVGPDTGKMKQFAANAVSYLRRYQLDGLDLDWEFPAKTQRKYFANFCTILRAAIQSEARSSQMPTLLLSMALPNNYYVAKGSYDIPTINKAVDFATAMTYDFHLYNKADTKTGYNSPLYTTPGDFKYYSAAAMTSYYVSVGLASQKLLMGIATYGRSWFLANSSSHGLHAPAVSKGWPGPYQHLPGIYTYADSCVALSQGATRVPDITNTTLGAAYLYWDSTWVAYDDVATLIAKCDYLLAKQLGGVGVWALHIDDIADVCAQGPLPLITTITNIIRNETRHRQTPKGLDAAPDSLGAMRSDRPVGQSWKQEKGSKTLTINPEKQAMP